MKHKSFLSMILLLLVSTTFSYGMEPMTPTGAREGHTVLDIDIPAGIAVDSGMDGINAEMFALTTVDSLLAYLSRKHPERARELERVRQFFVRYPQFRREVERNPFCILEILNESGASVRLGQGQSPITSGDGSIGDFGLASLDALIGQLSDFRLGKMEYTKQNKGGAGLLSAFILSILGSAGTLTSRARSEDSGEFFSDRSNVVLLVVTVLMVVGLVYLLVIKSKSYSQDSQDTNLHMHTLRELLGTLSSSAESVVGRGQTRTFSVGVDSDQIRRIGTRAAPGMFKVQLEQVEDEEE